MSGLPTTHSHLPNALLVERYRHFATQAAMLPWFASLPCARCTAKAQGQRVRHNAAKCAAERARMATDGAEYQATLPGLEAELRSRGIDPMTLGVSKSPLKWP